MLMGSVSGMFLADHSDSGSFLGVGITRPRGTPARRILGGGGMCGLVTFCKFSWLVRGLLVPSSFPGPPVVRSPVQVVTTVPGQGAGPGQGLP